MRFTALVLSALGALSLVAAQNEKRQQSSIDWASLNSAASRLKTAYPAGSATYSLPFVTPGGNLLQPPASLVGAIITGIPASVLVQVAGAAGRSSLASEFKAGNTPAWYQTLPEGVKSYISALASQFNKGDVNLSATPSANNWATSGIIAPTDASSPDNGNNNAAVSSSKSKGAAAAQPTAAPLGFSAMAALGILGIAIAL